MISQKWQLGVALVETMSYHHNPDDCTENSRDLVSTISLANQIVIEMKIGTAGDCISDCAMLDLLTGKVGVDYGKLSDFHGSVFREIEKARIFLEIVQK